MGSEFGGAPTYVLLRVGGVLLLFLLCLWAAVRRSRNGAEGNRALGIILSALVPMAGYPLFFGALSLVVAPILLFYVAYFVVVWIALPSLVSAAVADVILRLLGATRTWLWLALGVAAAIAITFFWFAWFFGSQPLFAVEFLFDYALLAFVPGSSALIWWAYLPPVEEDLAGAFE